jgi:hypothetical protein
MNKRSAIVISGALVMALMAGIVGANRAALHSTVAGPAVVVVHQQAPTHPASVIPERE